MGAAASIARSSALLPRPKTQAPSHLFYEFVRNLSVHV
jgi:hypothetical protein